MATVTKSKKPARKTAVRRNSAQKFLISPLTGLPVNPGQPGQKTVSRVTIKAALSKSI